MAWDDGTSAIWFSAATLQPPHSSISLSVAREFTDLLVLGTEAH